MQGEGNLPPLAAELQAETRGRSAAEVCTQRSSRIFPSVVEEDWGYSLRARGAELPLGNTYLRLSFGSLVAQTAHLKL